MVAFKCLRVGIEWLTTSVILRDANQPTQIHRTTFSHTTSSPFLLAWDLLKSWRKAFYTA
jgi:hypothetical protein